MNEVAMVGIGYYGFAPTTNEVSFREGAFLAAKRAYSECNIEPSKDVDSFVVCEEDFNEGIAISNEFQVDQLGAVLKPVATVTSESLIAFASANNIAYRLFKVIGREDLITLYLTNRERRKHREEIDSLIQEWIGQRTHKKK